MKKLAPLAFVILVFVAFLAFRTSTSASTESDVVAANIDLNAYANYSENTLAQSQLRGNSLLFFAATKWCQSCSQLEDEIVENINKVPNNVTILKVDYDNDKSTNMKHNVTVQHTLVLLDNQGEEIKRWIGGGFDTLIQNVELI